MITQYTCNEYVERVRIKKKAREKERKINCLVKFCLTVVRQWNWERRSLFMWGLQLYHHKAQKAASTDADGIFCILQRWFQKYGFFYAVAAVKLKSLYFLDVALRHFAFGARRFEVALRSHLLGSKYPASFSSLDISTLEDETTTLSRHVWHSSHCDAVPHPWRTRASF